jgi:ketosteroid isomerase-like protein
LDLVRPIIEAWGRGDFSDAGWADAEIEFVVDDVLSRETWTGVASLGKGWLTFLSSWEDYRVDVDEFRELDGDRVLVLVRHGGRGKRSGVEIRKSEGAILFELRGEKVARLVAYLDRRRAFGDLDIGSDA